MAKHNNSSNNITKINPATNVIPFKSKDPFINKIGWMVLILQVLGLSLITYLILK